MMNNIFRFLVKQYGKSVLRKWDKSVQYPLEYQRRLFYRLLKKAVNTQFGDEHRFSQIHTYAEFRQSVPFRNYDDFLPYFRKIRAGDAGVLYPGKPDFLAVSSGTTSGVKYIPVYEAFMRNYARSGLQMIFSYLRQTGNYEILSGENLFLQGSPALKEKGGFRIGRMSGISYYFMPRLFKRKQFPSYQTNIISDWEAKIRGIVEETISSDIRVIGGIPPWVLMYFDSLIDQTDEKSVQAIFPNLQLFIHGGVNIEPYRPIIRKKIGKQIHTLDTYTASEGFLGFQESLDDRAMTLCCDHGIFYEFVKLTDYQLHKKTARRYCLAGVKPHIDYVVLLNTESGLWSYLLGDIVRFTSTFPFKFILTGRVAQFTSLFGEHLIEAEVQKALEKAIRHFNLAISAFTVAPLLLPQSQLSHHEWWIEFTSVPADLRAVAQFIDREVCRQNTLYADLIEGKVISPLQIIPVPTGSFERCFLDEGRIDGQNKIPVLSNNRDLVDRLAPYVGSGPSNP